MLFAGALEGAIIGAVVGAVVGLIASLIKLLTKDSKSDEDRARSRSRRTAAPALGVMFWIGLIGLIVAGLALLIFLLLPLLTNGRASWREAAIGIIPSAVFTVGFLIVMLLGLTNPPRGARRRRRRRDDDDDDDDYDDEA